MSETSESFASGDAPEYAGPDQDRAQYHANPLSQFGDFFSGERKGLAAVLAAGLVGGIAISYVGQAGLKQWESWHHKDPNLVPTYACNSTSNKQLIRASVSTAQPVEQFAVQDPTDPNRTLYMALSAPLKNGSLDATVVKLMVMNSNAKTATIDWEAIMKGSESRPGLRTYTFDASDNIDPKALISPYTGYMDPSSEAGSSQLIVPDSSNQTNGHLNLAIHLREPQTTTDTARPASIELDASCLYDKIG